MKTLKAVLIPCLLLATAAAIAQSPSKTQNQTAAAQHKTEQMPQFFRLKFVLKELQGKKVIDSRTYTTEISAEPAGVRSGPTWNSDRSIRAGARIPIATGTYQNGSSVNAMVNTQFRYQEVGTNIDCSNPVLIGHRLAMQVSAQISSVANLVAITANNSSRGPREPSFPDDRWASEVLVPIGHPAVLFTSDDPTSTRTMELDLTATPLY